MSEPGMQTRDFVYITFEIVVGFVSVCSNSVVLAVICRTTRLHTVTNVFIGNLALADVMVGVSVTPCASLSYVGLPRNFYGCILVNSIILMVTNVSILMLLAIAIERFIAIKEPFLYERLLNINRAIAINVFVWVLGLSLGMVPLFAWNSGYHEVNYCRFLDVLTLEYMVYFQFFGLVLVPLAIMLIIYIYIIIVVKRHVRQSNALSEQVTGKPVRDHFKKDVKSARWLAMVIIIFGIFWLPINILNSIGLFCPQCRYSISLLLVAIVMSHANSCINPFLYAASNGRIKRAIKVMLGLRSPYERHMSDAQYLRRTFEGEMRHNTHSSIKTSSDQTHVSSDETLTAPRKSTVPEKKSVESVVPRVQKMSGVLRFLNYTGIVPCFLEASRLLGCAARVSGLSENVNFVNEKLQTAEEQTAAKQHKSGVLVGEFYVILNSTFQRGSFIIV